MTADISQTLLNHPKQVRFHLPRQAPNLLRHYQGDVNPTSPDKAVDVPRQSRDQSGLIEHRRVQQV